MADTAGKQLCSMRVMATVDTDEEAIKLKQAVEEAIKQSPTAQIQFNLVKLSNIPQPPQI